MAVFKDADGVATDEHGCTAWFINGNGNIEVHIGVNKVRKPPYGCTLIVNYASTEYLDYVREGLNRMQNKPIEISIVFYILFALSFFVAILFGGVCYRLGVMAEKISVLETQNPLPMEVKR